MKLLLVEDNPADVRIIREMLNDFPGEFSLANVQRLNDALALIATETFDAILLDLGLPDSTGLETLTSANPQISKTPVIVLTGLDCRELGLEAVRLGAQDYLVKGQTNSNLLVRSLRYSVERKRHEEILHAKNIELEKANLAKDRFLATMSHELRTPLNAILGFTGTLLMKLPGPLTADQEQQLRTVQSSGRHLLALINDLLDLAKVESGKVEVRCESIACQAVIEEVAISLNPLAVAKGLDFKVEVPNESVSVDSDRRIIGQILINLINNAIKFTNDGEVRIALATQQSGEDRFAAIEVKDTGVGIRPADKAKLFDAFQQVDTDRREEGTGLGLYLSKKLADLIQGRIELESEYGKGSVFRLLVPISLGEGNGAGSGC